MGNVVVPINEAEAIFEPFWDGGSSEHPTDKMNRLDPYTITIPADVIGSVEQIWCAVRIRFEKGSAGSVISFERDCDLAIAGYDILRVFTSTPSWVQLSVDGVIDGQPVTILPSSAGHDTDDEFDGAISGDRLTHLRLAFTLTEPRPASLQVLWLGLANRARQIELESRLSPYTPDWPGLLVPEVDLPAALQPQIGIFFDAGELDALRAAVHADPLAASYSQLLRQAQEYLAWEPEKDIGKYVPKPDRRWVRNRDMNRRATAGVMETLAFVGLMEQDVSMLRMAARMAISAAHCETWSESIVGALPGTTWHHRSFTEEIYARGCSLLLDWAGCMLTPHAKQLIRDAIIMKALPRIESDFKRMEYIRHMNQGIVFSSGRIIGVLGLLPAHPRYASLIDEAERDLHEMIANYVHADGGTLEGMGYWAYTFSSTMPVMYALSRYRRMPLSEYATPALRKTGDYGLGMLSTTGGGSTYLPVNDAHSGGHYPPGLLAAYCQLSGRPEWHALYAQVMQAEAATPDIYHLIMAPRESFAAEPGLLSRPRFDVFPDVGQVSSVRCLDSGALVHVHLCSGPTYRGHFHQDKGSLIIEAGGEALAYDRGVTSYHHPEVGLIGMAARHNLVYPEAPSGRFITQPALALGGRLTSALDEKGWVLACSDNTDAWEEGIFTRTIRRIASPCPDLILVDDEIILQSPLVVSFRLNSPFAPELRDADCLIAGKQVGLRVVPLNWEPVGRTAGVEGIDDHLHPAYLLRLASGEAGQHRLLTALEVVRTGDGAPGWTWDAGPALRLRKQETIVTVETMAADVLELAVARGGQITRARCRAGVWRVE